jgi:hypothetical protein
VENSPHRTSRSITSLWPRMLLRPTYAPYDVIGLCAILDEAVWPSQMMAVVSYDSCIFIGPMPFSLKRLEDKARWMRSRRPDKPGTEVGWLCARFDTRGLYG